jgi:hypothetical protein
VFVTVRLSDVRCTEFRPSGIGTELLCGVCGVVVFVCGVCLWCLVVFVCGVCLWWLYVVFVVFVCGVL